MGGGLDFLGWGSDGNRGNSRGWLWEEELGLFLGGLLVVLDLFCGLFYQSA